MAGQAIWRSTSTQVVSLFPTTTLTQIQVQSPSGGYLTRDASVSSGDFSFDAQNDGKYTYCFSNENWSANTKEVSFNVHGIVYVPESDIPQDPLEKEGELQQTCEHVAMLTMMKYESYQNFWRKSRMSNHTLWCGKGLIEILQRVRMQESNGGQYSSLAS